MPSAPVRRRMGQMARRLAVTLLAFATALAAASPAAGVRFAPVGPIEPVANSSGMRTTMADLNRDGLPDLVVHQEYEASVSVLLGKRDGSLVRMPDVAMTTGGGGVLPYLVDEAVADIDGDEIPDLIATTAEEYPQSGLVTALGNGDGTFTAGPSTDLGWAEHKALVAARIDADTDIDIATAAGFRPGGGDGTFGALTSIDWSSEGLWTLEAGDLNGDGEVDLVAGLSSPTDAGPVHVSLGNGDGSFHPEIGYPAETPEPGVPVSIAVADLDSDGNDDVATVEAWGANRKDLFVRYADAAGALTLGGTATLPSTTEVVTAADVSREGNVDLILSSYAGLDATGLPNAPGEIAVLYGNGANDFVADVYELDPYGAWWAGAALVNDDLWPDLMVVLAGGLGFSATSDAGVMLSAPDITITPDKLTFGDRTVGSTGGAQTAVVHNYDGPALALRSLRFGSGAVPADFSLAADSCSGATIEPGQECRIAVAFTARGVGDRSDVLRDDAVLGGFELPVAGRGVTAPPAAARRDATAPVLEIGIARQRLRHVLRRGLRVKVTVSEPTTVTASMRGRLPRAPGRSGVMTLGRTTKKVRDGSAVVVVKLGAKSRRALLRAPRARVRVRVQGRDAADNVSRTLQRTLTLRR